MYQGLHCVYSWSQAHHHHTTFSDGPPLTVAITLGEKIDHRKQQQQQQRQRQYVTDASDMDTKNRRRSCKRKNRSNSSHRAINSNVTIAFLLRQAHVKCGRMTRISCFSFFQFSSNRFAVVAESVSNDQHHCSGGGFQSSDYSTASELRLFANPRRALASHHSTMAPRIFIYAESGTRTRFTRLIGTIDLRHARLRVNASPPPKKAATFVFRRAGNNLIKQRVLFRCWSDETIEISLIVETIVQLRQMKKKNSRRNIFCKKKLQEM